MMSNVSSGRSFVPWLFLTGCLYTLFYLAHPSLPGNNAAYPLGWWGWLDQGNYLRSTVALAHGNLSPQEHWFPLGFSILGVPFVSVMPNHPYFVVDGLCLAVAGLLFSEIGKQFGLSLVQCWSLFLGSLIFDPRVFGCFVVPWSTTPIVVYVYAATWIVIREKPVGRSAALIFGAAAAACFITRPSDSVLFLPLGLAFGWRAFRQRFSKIPELFLAAATSFFAIFAIFAALHLLIYGLHFSDYETYSRMLGLDVSAIPPKLFAFFVDPKPLYGEGEPILRRSPWIVLSLFGAIVLCKEFGWRGLLILLVVTFNVLTYAAYVDLDPIKLFKYFNIHYFKLSYPLLALLAFCGVRYAFTDVRLSVLAFALPVLVFMMRYDIAHFEAKAEILDSARLHLTCSDCNLVNLIALPLSGIDPDQALNSTVLEVGTKQYKSLFQFRVNGSDGRLRIIFPRAITLTEATLIFKLPNGHGYQTAIPDASIGQGRFSLGKPSFRR